MASWWRLRTQVSLVIAVLIFLIAFLGLYALNEARKHAGDVDELLGTNFKAVALIKEIESSESQALKARAKFKITHDKAYIESAKQMDSLVNSLFVDLESLPGSDHILGTAVLDLRDQYSNLKSLKASLLKIERLLQEHRARKIERIRVAAKLLRKIILTALLTAMVVTMWLALVFYFAVMKPLQHLENAAKRIRDGELSHRVIAFASFKELASLRDEFNAMAAKLEELDRIKGEFLATVSHELKTPLTALKEGLLLLKEKQGNLSMPVSTKITDVCLQASKRLEMMIQNLLNHAKMESGFYSFDERPKNFIAVVESAIQGLKPLAERRGLSFQLKTQSRQCEASFSSEGITHVMENLLLNAVKYGDNSKPIVIEIQQLHEKPVPSLEVKVTNYGKGLMPHELTQIFGRFVRGSNAGGQSGVGIGLNVVKRIIEAHHGVVFAQSAGGLTTFTFRIPQRYESRSEVFTLSEAST